MQPARKKLKNLLPLSVLFGVIATPIGVSPAAAQSLYQIGNSFTVDSQPLGIQALASNANIDLDIGVHARCGSSATTILRDPERTCVVPNFFGRFTDALPNNEWDHISIQSHRDGNATLASEVNSIANLIDLAKTNPSNADTKFYLYQAWGFRGGSNRIDLWEAPIPDNIDQQVTHRRDYFLRLHNEIEARGHDLTIIPTGDALYRVLEEARAGNIAGIKDRNDLYRDGLHLTFDVGRFIAGTTVLTTILGRDLTGVEIPNGFYELDGAAVPEALRDQLQSIVWDVVRSHPEAGLIDQLTTGDYDFDGLVSESDFSAWRADFGSTTRQSTDGDRDYTVSAADYVVLRDNVQSTTLQTIEASSVPEPGGFGLALVICAGLLGGRSAAGTRG